MGQGSWGSLQVMLIEMEVCFIVHILYSFNGLSEQCVLKSPISILKTSQETPSYVTRDFLGCPGVWDTPGVLTVNLCLKTQNQDLTVKKFHMFRNTIGSCTK